MRITKFIDYFVSLRKRFPTLKELEKRTIKENKIKKNIIYNVKYSWHTTTAWNEGCGVDNTKTQGKVKYYIQGKIFLTHTYSMKRGVQCW